jgi:hypothetical protein
VPENQALCRESRKHRERLNDLGFIGLQRFTQRTSLRDKILRLKRNQLLLPGGTPSEPLNQHGRERQKSPNDTVLLLPPTAGGGVLILRTLHFKSKAVGCLG